LPNSEKRLAHVGLKARPALKRRVEDRFHKTPFAAKLRPPEGRPHEPVAPPSNVTELLAQLVGST
jgi:hypothetical protein